MGIEKFDFDISFCIPFDKDLFGKVISFKKKKNLKVGSIENNDN